MTQKTLSQDEIERRLIEAGVAWRSGTSLVGDSALLAINGTGYLVYPMADSDDLKARLKQQLTQLFADAGNVSVEEPIGRPVPQDGIGGD